MPGKSTSKGDVLSSRLSAAGIDEDWADLGGL